VTVSGNSYPTPASIAREAVRGIDIIAAADAPYGVLEFRERSAG